MTMRSCIGSSSTRMIRFGRLSLFTVGMTWFFTGSVEMARGISVWNRLPSPTWLDTEILPPRQVHKSLGYRKAEPEAFRRNVWAPPPFKRSEYAFYRFLVHADARVLHLHGHYHVLVAYPETDCSVAGELDSVSQQVVRHLTDTVRISVYPLCRCLLLPF